MHSFMLLSMVTANSLLLLMNDALHIATVRCCQEYSLLQHCLILMCTQDLSTGALHLYSADLQASLC